MSCGEPSGALGYIFSGAVLRRNLLITGVVGCLLTLANQYDVLFSRPPSGRLWVKMGLNFLIPFAVSSISAAVNRPRPDGKG